MYEIELREIRNTDELFSVGDDMFNRQHNRYYLQVGGSQVQIEAHTYDARFNPELAGKAGIGILIPARLGFGGRGAELDVVDAEQTGKAWFALVAEQLQKYGVQMCIQCNEGLAWSKPANSFHSDKEIYGEYTPICATCFDDNSSAKYKKFCDDLLAKEARDDAKQKAKGFTHKTIMWVHPSRGGDDYELVMYTKGEAGDAQIKSTLRKRGSRVLTDYKQTPL